MELAPSPRMQRALRQVQLHLQQQQQTEPLDAPHDQQEAKGDDGREAPPTTSTANFSLPQEANHQHHHEKVAALLRTLTTSRARVTPLRTPSSCIPNTTAGSTSYSASIEGQAASASVSSRAPLASPALRMRKGGRLVLRVHVPQLLEYPRLFRHVDQATITLQCTAYRDETVCIDFEDYLISKQQQQQPQQGWAHDDLRSDLRDDENEEEDEEWVEVRLRQLFSCTPITAGCRRLFVTKQQQQQGPSPSSSSSSATHHHFGHNNNRATSPAFKSNDNDNASPMIGMSSLFLSSSSSASPPSVTVLSELMDEVLRVVRDEMLIPHVFSTGKQPPPITTTTTIASRGGAMTPVIDAGPSSSSAASRLDNEDDDDDNDDDGKDTQHPFALYSTAAVSFLSSSSFGPLMRTHTNQLSSPSSGRSSSEGTEPSAALRSIASKYLLVVPLWQAHDDDDEGNESDKSAATTMSQAKLKKKRRCVVELSSSSLLCGERKKTRIVLTPIDIEKRYSSPLFSSSASPSSPTPPTTRDSVPTTTAAADVGVGIPSALLLQRSVEEPQKKTKTVIEEEQQDTVVDLFLFSKRDV